MQMKRQFQQHFHIPISVALLDYMNYSPFSFECKKLELIEGHALNQGNAGDCSEIKKYEKNYDSTDSFFSFKK